MDKQTNSKRNPMKTTLTILFAILIIACKKQETSQPIATATHEVHGLVKVTIESNGIVNHNIIFKTDTVNNIVNHKTLFESYNNSENYILNSKEAGYYQVYAISNSDSLITSNNNCYIKLKVVDEYGKILIDSLRTAETILSSKWQTGIVYTFKVK